MEWPQTTNLDKVATRFRESLALYPNTNYVVPRQCYPLSLGQKQKQKKHAAVTSAATDRCAHTAEAVGTNPSLTNNIILECVLFVLEQVDDKCVLFFKCGLAFSFLLYFFSDIKIKFSSKTKPTVCASHVSLLGDCSLFPPLSLFSLP